MQIFNLYETFTGFLKPEATERVMQVKLLLIVLLFFFFFISSSKTCISMIRLLYVPSNGPFKRNIWSNTVQNNIIIIISGMFCLQREKRRRSVQTSHIFRGSLQSLCDLHHSMFFPQNRSKSKFCLSKIVSRMETVFVLMIPNPALIFIRVYAEDLLIFKGTLKGLASNTWWCLIKPLWKCPAGSWRMSSDVSTNTAGGCPDVSLTTALKRRLEQRLAALSPSWNTNMIYFASWYKAQLLYM